MSKFAPVYGCLVSDDVFGRFRDIGELRAPCGRIEDGVTARVLMERDTWERLAGAADMRGTSAAEIIRVLVAEWLDKVKA